MPSPGACHAPPAATAPSARHNPGQAELSGASSLCGAIGPALRDTRRPLLSLPEIPKCRHLPGYLPPSGPHPRKTRPAPSSHHLYPICPLHTALAPRRAPKAHHPLSLPRNPTTSQTPPTPNSPQSSAASAHLPALTCLAHTVSSKTMVSPRRRAPRWSHKAGDCCPSPSPQPI